MATDISSLNADSSGNMLAMQAENRKMQQEGLQVQMQMAQDNTEYETKSSIIEQTASIGKAVSSLSDTLSQRIVQ